jgi:hypothetical protein
VRFAVSIAEHARKALDDHAEGWLDRGLEEAADGVASRTAELDDEIAAATRDGGEADPMARLEREGLRFAPKALDAIGARKPALLRWGKAKAGGVLILLGAGKEEEARLLAMATGLTLEQYLAGSDLSTARTSQVTLRRARDTEEVVALVREIGLGALKAALPFLLAAL